MMQFLIDFIGRSEMRSLFLYVNILTINLVCTWSSINRSFNINDT